MREASGIGCAGFCRNCGRVHTLPAAPAYQSCLELMAELDRAGRLDFEVKDVSVDSRFSTSSLFGDCRGKMFGVMVARSLDAGMVVLRAFSGQYNGVWEVPGWVEPVFDPAEFHQVHDDAEKKIKQLGLLIDREEIDSSEQQHLILVRKQLSQRLMGAIHGLYQFRNFAGQRASLREIFPPVKGIPAGTGDCCAPKLLQYAVKHRLIPLGLAEFYWGKSNRSGSRCHGTFYSSCRSKCYPVLGFILCGLEERGSYG